MRSRYRIPEWTGPHFRHMRAMRIPRTLLRRVGMTTMLRDRYDGYEFVFLFLSI